MKKIITYTIVLISLINFSSCESEAEINQRKARELQQRIELEGKRKQEEQARALKLENERLKKEAQLEKERIETEAKLAKERKEKAIYDKYINNSLTTGTTPYAYCFGGNKSCSGYGCSQIKVKTPSNSDVLVTIKKDGKVYRHAYIKAGNRYTFEFPNGTYQAFFYYGMGWNPDKVMKKTNCGMVKGGFIANEHFSKDSPQTLSNNILEYELILQQNGNFSTKPSSSDEAL
jgi:hypothetical protein